MKADLSKMSDAELEAELDRRKKVKKTKPVPKSKPDWSQVWNFVIDSIESVDTEGRHPMMPKDFDHYVYEAVIEAVYGKEFWEWHNKIFG